MGEFTTFEMSQAAPQPQVPNYGLDGLPGPRPSQSGYPTDWERFRTYFPQQTPESSPASQAPESKPQLQTKSAPEPQTYTTPPPKEMAPTKPMAEDIGYFKSESSLKFPLNLSTLQQLAAETGDPKLRLVAKFLVKNFESLSSLSPDGAEQEISKGDLNLYSELLKADEKMMPAFDARHHVKKQFTAIDTNGDESLSLAELESFQPADAATLSATEYFKKNFRHISREQGGSVQDALISKIDLASLADDTERVKKLKSEFVDEELDRRTAQHQFVGGAIGLVAAAALLYYTSKDSKVGITSLPRFVSFLGTGLTTGSQSARWLAARQMEGDVNNYYDQKAKLSMDKLFALPD